MEKPAFEASPWAAYGKLALVVGRTLDPREIHILIPGTYEYVTLHGKRDFADEIKVRLLDREIIPDYLGGTSLITSP